MSSPIDSDYDGLPKQLDFDRQNRLVEARRRAAAGEPRYVTVREMRLSMSRMLSREKLKEQRQAWANLQPAVAMNQAAKRLEKKRA